MSDFFGKLKSGAGKVAFEAEKMTRLNKAKGEVDQIKRQIEAQYNKLGEMYYRKFLNQEAEGPEFGEACQQITQLGQQMELKGEEVQRITAETYAPQGAAPVAAAPASPAPVQTSPMPAPAAAAPVQPAAAAAPQVKYCPNCGKEMAVTVKFCPDCGTKV